jgi:hypothetical protein
MKDASACYTRASALALYELKKICEVAWLFASVEVKYGYRYISHVDNVVIVYVCVRFGAR